MRIPEQRREEYSLAINEKGHALHTCTANLGLALSPVLSSKGHAGAAVNEWLEWHVRIIRFIH